MKRYRPTWAEISLGSIGRNTEQILSLLTPGCRLMAIVKANAYGHGVVPVTRRVLEAGASFLGVATLEEALELRDAGITVPILILAAIEPCFADLVVEHDIRTTVFTPELAEALGAAARARHKEALVHLKVDTGMNRIGVQADDQGLSNAIRIMKTPGLRVEGIFSHLATADEKDKTEARKQMAHFHRFVEAVESVGYGVEIKHLGNSAAILDLEEARMDMVRAGIILYGLYPSDEVQKQKINLEPAMRFLTHVAHVKDVPAGYGISYGHTHVPEESARIATLPVGYADGYSRLCSNRASVGISGQMHRVVGRVCMDQTMVDVSGSPVKHGDLTVLFGRGGDGVTADDLAHLMKTINYEVTCLVSSRVPRLFVE
jgi:alanine racemase